MNGKNNNVSDTFGKYNNSVGEVKNVSSSMWEPISAGKSSSAQQSNAARGKTADKKSASASPEKKKRSSASKSKKSDKEKNILISQGASKQKKQPPKKQTAKKQPTEKSAEKKIAQSKKKPPSRTPKGRDMRKDAREQQKHREELFKFREDYRRKLENQYNHDEISRMRNENKRKKLVMKNAVTVGSVVMFALIFILIFCYSRGALIENIIIDGSSIYTAEEIQQAAGISRGKNMLSLREKKVRRDITTKLPYIKEVTMQYDLPDTLILTVSGTNDKYAITGQNSWLVLDSDGKVVSDVKQKIGSGLFRIDGFDFQQFSLGDSYEPEGANIQRYNLMQKLVELFEKSEIVDTAVINLENTEDVTVVIDEKIAVYLGDCKNLEEKIPYASGIIAQVRAANQKGYIDMRFDLGYFKPGSMTIE